MKSASIQICLIRNSMLSISSDFHACEKSSSAESDHRNKNTNHILARNGVSSYTCLSPLALLYVSEGRQLRVYVAWKAICDWQNGETASGRNAMAPSHLWAPWRVCGATLICRLPIWWLNWRALGGAGNHKTGHSIQKLFFCISLTLEWPAFLYADRMASGGQGKNESLNKTCKGKMKIEATEMLWKHVLVEADIGRMIPRSLKQRGLLTA